MRGWKWAVDAQHRIVAAVQRVIAEASGTGDIAVISHVGVGALLLCHLEEAPISRAEDQPRAGGGCIYSLDIATRALISGWHLIDD